MKLDLNEKYFNQITQKIIKNKNVYGTTLCVENGENTISWLGSSGNIEKGDRYFIASVTKLYVTAVMLILREKGFIDFEDKITKFIDDNILCGLHILKGVDYTSEITVLHLLSNTSGVPDYVRGKAGKTLFEGKDEVWSFEKVIRIAKKTKPKFMPGQKGKADYSDTNYRLLGRIIEQVTGKNLGEIFQEYIINPLGLQDTYAYNDINDNTPISLYYKSNQIDLPYFMTSATAEAGIVSTAKEVMIFLKAFFNDYFFSRKLIDELKKWNLVLYPGQFYYGIGLEKLWVPRIMTPIRPIKEILGFWGQSGAFAFYNPETDLYFTGTANQINGFGHQAALKAIIKIIKDYH